MHGSSVWYTKVVLIWQYLLLFQPVRYFRKVKMTMIDDDPAIFPFIEILPAKFHAKWKALYGFYCRYLLNIFHTYWRKLCRKALFFVQWKTKSFLNFAVISVLLTFNIILLTLCHWASNYHFLIYPHIYNVIVFVMFIRANIFNNHYPSYFHKVADWNFKFGLKIAPSKLFYREKVLKDKLGGNLLKN